MGATRANSNREVPPVDAPLRCRILTPSLLVCTLGLSAQPALRFRGVF